MSPGVSPLLVIVSGPPASGKTTIGQMLAAALELPLLTKDGIKELLADSLNVEGIEWSKKLGVASFELLFDLANRLLTAGTSVIIEGNFDPDQSADRFAVIVRDAGATVVQVICRAEADELMERYKRRDASGKRHSIHTDGDRVSDESFEAQLRRDSLPPLKVEGHVIEIDTTDGETVDITAIAAEIKLSLPVRLTDDQG
ncbi:MAG TPA: AAA family ATPase [Nitrolancea sp.]